MAHVPSFNDPFCIGDVGDTMFFLNSGTIEVYTRDGFSKLLRQPGEFFGKRRQYEDSALALSTYRMHDKRTNERI